MNISAEFVIWYQGHKTVCDLSHNVPSASMEIEVSSIIWKRTLDYVFQYNTFLSLGDTKVFTHLLEQHMYGKDVILKKEECIIHVSKRLGTRDLRNVAKKHFLGCYIR